jgi:hypothetical protein
VVIFARISAPAVLKKENSAMPSQENEKAMDGLLRRSLMRDSRASGDCPDAEFLAAYFEQSLGADEAVRYELHFSQCTRCREQLAAMASAHAEQTADVAPVEPVLVGVRPTQAIALGRDRIAAQAKPAAASAGKVPSQKPPDSRWLDLRWLIPVAAVLVLGTFVFMRFASRDKTAGLDNKVAISKSTPPPQEQIPPEPEKKSADVGARDKNMPKNQASAAGTPRNPPSAKRAARSAPNSESTQVQRSEGGSLRGGTTSRSATAATPRSSRAPSQGAVGRASTLQSQKQAGGAAGGAAVQESRNGASEPAPAAPAPELNASMPAIVVATDSADAVKSPAPAPPPNAEQKSQAFGVTSQSLRGSAAAKSLAKAKPAQERYSETVIATPDSDVFYRISTGGYVDVSEDGGVAWQRQLLNPSAEFTAGAAPEPRICWLVGRSGIVFLTEDGKTWRKLPSPTADDLAVVVAKSASTATVTANDNRKWSTDDAGESWRPTK